jgi:hypothetical protein
VFSNEHRLIGRLSRLHQPLHEITDSNSAYRHAIQRRDRTNNDSSKFCMLVFRMVGHSTVTLCNALWSALWGKHGWRCPSEEILACSGSGVKSIGIAMDMYDKQNAHSPSNVVSCFSCLYHNHALPSLSQCKQFQTLWEKSPAPPKQNGISDSSDRLTRFFAPCHNVKVASRPLSRLATCRRKLMQQTIAWANF